MEKSQIIVLHTVKHADTGLVVQCYSNHYGRIALYLRGGGKKKSAIAMLHRLAIIDVITEAGRHGSGTSSMAKIKEMSAALTLADIRTNVYKSAIAMFIAELLMKTIKEVEANTQLYSFLSSSIGLLEHIKEGSNNFHLYFLVHLSKILGFMPLNDYSADNPIFNIHSASFCKEPDNTTLCFSKEESLLLAQIIKLRAIDIANIKCNGAMRNAFSKQMIKYLEHHLACDIEIKSLDVLHQVFK